MAVARDSQGYMLDLSAWDEETAMHLAKESGIDLDASHWEIIYAVRDFYQRFDSAPATRALIKWLALELGKDKGNSLYVMELFPNGAAKLIAKIAGLPRPTNCI